MQLPSLEISYDILLSSLKESEKKKKKKHITVKTSSVSDIFRKEYIPKLKNTECADQEFLFLFPLFFSDQENGTKPENELFLLFNPL